MSDTVQTLEKSSVLQKCCRNCPVWIFGFARILLILVLIIFLKRLDFIFTVNQLLFACEKILKVDKDQIFIANIFRCELDVHVVPY
jgi:hypothetical protein